MPLQAKNFGALNLTDMNQLLTLGLLRITDDSLCCYERILFTPIAAMI